MSDKFPRAKALETAKFLCDLLKPVTERLIVAGSLRRLKMEVSDVEIFFIPKMIVRRVDFFAESEHDLAAEIIESLVKQRWIYKRLNSRGSETWGAKNKLAIHRSGVPVDFFATTEANWFNYLVCWTGSAENNIRIASAAQNKGWKWNPYGPGFTGGGALAGEVETYEVKSEREVFEFVGLTYLEPCRR